MHIHFERSGGLMGRSLSCSVDTDTLPDDEAISLQELVAAASFFDLPAESKQSEVLYDQFQYKVVIEHNEVKHTVEMTDTSAPNSLRPLLRRLTIMTRSHPGSATTAAHSPD